MKVRSLLPHSEIKHRMRKLSKKMEMYPLPNVAKKILHTGEIWGSMQHFESKKSQIYRPKSATMLRIRCVPSSQLYATEVPTTPGLCLSNRPRRRLCR